MKKDSNDNCNLISINENYKKIKKDIILSAKLNRLYAYKSSMETVNTKINNQLNSMYLSIDKINPKFKEKSKNYEKVRAEIISIIDEYEEVLKQLSNEYDKKIEEMLLKKVELESKLIMVLLSKHCLENNSNQKHSDSSKINIIKGINTVVDKIKTKVSKKEPVDLNLINQLKDGQDIENEIKKDINQSDEYKQNQFYISKLEKEIKIINRKVKELENEKIDKMFNAMEVGDKSLSTQIRKPRTFKKITKFIVNRINSYNIIMKNIIIPFKQRIDEFRVNELKKVTNKVDEFDLKEWEKEIISIQKQEFNKFDNKLIFQKLKLTNE